MKKTSIIILFSIFIASPLAYPEGVLTVGVMATSLVDEVKKSIRYFTASSNDVCEYGGVEYSTGSIVVIDNKKMKCQKVKKRIKQVHLEGKRLSL